MTSGEDDAWTLDTLPERTAPPAPIRPSGEAYEPKYPDFLGLKRLEGAACVDHPQEYWFDHDQFDKGKAICQTCPAREECLDQALDLGGLSGNLVWGGLTWNERKGLRTWRP